MMQGADDGAVMLGPRSLLLLGRTARFLRELNRTGANIRMAQGERENMINVIASEVNDALLKVESAKERLMLSVSPYSQAEQTLESALAAYRTGKQEFLMLIDIQGCL